MRSAMPAVVRSSKPCRSARPAVGEIVDRLDLGQPQVSKHLKVLRQVGLVRCRSEGRHRLYRVHGPALQPLQTWLTRLTAGVNEHYDRLDDYLHDHLQTTHHRRPTARIATNRPGEGVTNVNPTRISDGDPAVRHRDLDHPHVRGAALAGVGCTHSAVAPAALVGPGLAPAGEVRDRPAPGRFVALHHPWRRRRRTGLARHIPPHRGPGADRVDRGVRGLPRRRVVQHDDPHRDRRRHHAADPGAALEPAAPRRSRAVGHGGGYAADVRSPRRSAGRCRQHCRTVPPSRRRLHRARRSGAGRRVGQPGALCRLEGARRSSTSRRMGAVGDRPFGHRVSRRAVGRRRPCRGVEEPGRHPAGRARRPRGG